MSEQKKRKKSLLDEDDDAAPGATDFGLRVNKQYAARFEHNKRREELHRLQSKYPEEAEKLARKMAREAARAAGEELPEGDVDGDSSEDEEEDDGEIPEQTEAKIFDTLLRIRNRDPSVYQKDVHFFDDAEEPEEDAGKDAKGKKAKAMYLKDMIAKQALEYGPAGESSDEEPNRRGRDSRHPKAYDPEQENLRKAFLQAAEDAEDAGAAEGLGAVLRLREKAQAAEADDDAAGPSAKKAKRSAKAHTQEQADGQFQKLIEAYFGSDDALNPDDKFLKQYIVNKGWVDRDDDYVPSYHDVVGDEDRDGADGDASDGGIADEEDERYLREMDAFEAKYNFRFEEPGADRIITHPRNVEGTVRKPEDKRKRHRDAKKQRQQEEEEAAREELKRLKNLKKQEIESKLEKLRHVAGAAAPAAASLDDMLDGDFDPEEWDKKMAEAFDDAYYEVEEDLENLRDDVDLLGADLEDEDDELGADGADGDAEGGPLRFATIQRKLKEVDAASEDPEDDGDGGKLADPEVLARQRAELQRLLEDYYKLDYEDVVGGVKTRFRYKEVGASTFGLSVDDILRLDDKTLNQVVGIKRLAPYREDVSKLRPNYKALEMIKGDLAAKGPGQRRYNKKREWQKAKDGKRGGQWWREGREAGEAAGMGSGSRSEAPPDGQQQPSGIPQGAGHPGPGQQEAKVKGRAPEGTGAAGPGSGSEAAAKLRGGGQKRHVGNSPHGFHHQAGARKGSKQGGQAMDPQQARLASYAVPTLKKDTGGVYNGKGATDKKRKRDQQSKSNDVAPSGGEQLTKAQRKNLKRSQKRASKRGGETPAAVE